ncbi:flavin monoamine oxidase family protein [Chengkuizengella axinellae]|uniref:FAD-dependent oxidoreductase n=1 Tax=Chengkuizengella axinellae TaxID=3064388 RepID=A0ABT9J4D7_9BACL|nr:FAD-dependent oxidoreductase [Chengkuizengella sp. 2205SS18-9]MDP5276496.1 FAD-dependent oxidoreductase [Chengkuizengella sp. 2205SS18-9]
MNDPIVIVGAGLSGLRAATLLISQGYDCKVLEARARIGGRVLSNESLNRPDLGKFDLGPTWFWPKHEPVISRLVKELGLQTFVQHTEGAMLLEQFQNKSAQRYIVPEGSVERSIRLSGGIKSLIDAVADTIPQGRIELDTRVTALRIKENGTLIVEANHTSGKKENIRARAVIFALPPRIVANHIKFSPKLSPKLFKSLNNKPTWMAGQAKVVTIYDHPFWRENGLSGQVTSRVGPLQEIHDASPETGCGALFGFFGMHAKQRQKHDDKEVIKLVIEQLSRLFGSSANKPIDILYKDWSSDPETAVDDDLYPLLTYPNYGPPTGMSTWEKKIIFAGTETESEYGGHLEGALRSASRAVSEINEL